MSFPPDKNSHPVGLLLRCARILRGISLTELATAIGIDPSYLSRIETCQRPLPPQIAARLARALSLPQGERR